MDVQYVIYFLERPFPLARKVEMLRMYESTLFSPLWL